MARRPVLPAADTDDAIADPTPLLRDHLRRAVSSGRGLTRDARAAVTDRARNATRRIGSAAPAALAAHPTAVQRTGIAMVFVVIASGAITATAAPSASPVAARHPHQVAHAAPGTVGSAESTAPVEQMILPATSQLTLRGRAGHAAAPAPVDHGVISSLAANGIPTVALNAYRVAAARMANVDPSCGIPWYLLAGIGREESDHGRFDGAVLHADGVSTPKIIGPALDGKTWDYIPAPADGVALDGDAKYAHALGPMQFIPQTWAIYGADANGDGKADIFNINDAALGAARYLCAAGGDLTTTAGKTRAVLAYNHNDQYLAQVLALADAYKKGIAITGLPVGITKGALPKVRNTGYIPPANPGAPTAGDGKSKGAKPTRSSSSPTSGKATGSGTPTSGTRPTGSPTRSGSPGSGTPSGSGSTSPSPSPTKSCDPIEQGLDRLRPPGQRVCAGD